MDRERQRIYQRGYNAGRSSRWPDHKPPLPPGAVGALIVAARALRDAVDTQLAMGDPDDPLEAELGPHIDALDEAMRGVTGYATGFEFAATTG